MRWFSGKSFRFEEILRTWCRERVLSSYLLRQCFLVINAKTTGTLFLQETVKVKNISKNSYTIFRNGIKNITLSFLL